jgi:hypothetical protein
MKGQRYWVHHGLMEQSAAGEQLTPDAEQRLFDDGIVRLTTGQLGTEIKWVVNSPCVSSLLRVLHWVSSVKPPYILRFHAVGWFEEVYRTSTAVQQRIEQVLVRGDRHFTGRVFFEEASPQSDLIPEVVRAAVSGHDVSNEYAVECSFDLDSKLYRVERVGPKSAIGRVWGTFTSSHPCQIEGSYGDPVNATYDEVMRLGKPRYDHVLAALRLPDNALHWVPYHRFVMPKRDAQGRYGVAVVSEIAKVDIQVL